MNRTNTFIEEIVKSPWRVGLNRKVVSAIATKRTMTHVDKKADPLLSRVTILCMLLEKSRRCDTSFSTHLVMFGNKRLVQPWAMSAPPPPTPQHILRSHSSPISALSVSGDNERIYSGDASGKVVVTSTGSLRAITQWNAHTDSILGVDEWDNHIVTYVCIDFYSTHFAMLNKCM